MNTIRQTLRSGGTTIGSWMQLQNESVAEIMGCAGYDWVAVDLEHGSISLDSLPGLFRALELGGTVPFARVAQNSAKDIKQALDAGARGIIVPMIETQEDVENAVAWANYPPLGTRGVGFSRANLFGKRFKGYFNSINEEIVMVAQIESIAAVRALDRILTVPGLDAIFIGPYDLSASMGLTGQFEHQEFVDAIKLAEQKAREHRVPMGLHVVEPDPDQIRAKVQDGYRLLAYGIDALFLHRSASNPMKTAGQ